ncbi:hypothetical protein [Clostridium polynesiense]|uniref:hypothetical protein n=1 Tax=Clostridium polynesiense TaxID=1325933 RepID=UPI00058BBAC2|nr:hypothetical protein [Clostridium polynesiense]
MNQHPLIIPFENVIDFPEGFKELHYKIKTYDIIIKPDLACVLHYPNKIYVTGNFDYTITLKFLFYPSYKSQDNTVLITSSHSLRLNAYHSSSDYTVYQAFYPLVSCRNASYIITASFKNKKNSSIKVRGEFYIDILYESIGDIKNGSFEDGFSHWNITSGSSGKYETSKNYKEHYPLEGINFAVLKSCGENSFTGLSQGFSAKKDSILKGYAFFSSGDIPLFDNYAEIILKDLSASEEISLYKASVNSSGNTPWTSFQYQFQKDGSYILEGRVVTLGDPIFESFLGLDNIHLLFNKD